MFQMELHLLITWAESQISLNYRIFEDMHHGITINQEFEKYKITYMHFGFEEF